MKNILSLAIAILLTFIAISLLIAALQYSSDLIGVRVQNNTTLPTDVNISGFTNNTGDNSPDSSGAQQSSSQNSGSGLNLINLSSLVYTSGGDPKNPDTREPPYLLIILIILVVLVFLALIGYILWRRRRRGHKIPSAPGQGVETSVGPVYVEGGYRIRFPQISEPFPVIWGENEALDVIIESKDGATDNVALDIDGQMRQEVKLENGKAQVRLKLDKGEHRITVGAKDSTVEPSWAVIRIVDYREEIVRMFNEMYLNYSSRYDGIGDKMTPRELEVAIGLEMPETNRKALDAAVTIFEFANYSLHAMRRRDYERMYQSKLDVGIGGPAVGVNG